MLNPVLVRQSSSKNAPVQIVHLKHAVNFPEVLAFVSSLGNGVGVIRIPLNVDDACFQRGALMSHCYIFLVSRLL